QRGDVAARELVAVDVPPVRRLEAVALRHRVDEPRAVGQPGDALDHVELLDGDDRGARGRRPLLDEVDARELERAAPEEQDLVGGGVGGPRTRWSTKPGSSAPSVVSSAPYVRG